jgi:aspartate-semialdehyde dehydrogenase
VEFEKSVTAERVRDVLEKARGVTVLDNPQKGVYPTPLDAVDTDNVYVGRIRRDESVKNGVNLWVVADNVRKGAATNAVQIAQLLCNQADGREYAI